MAQIARSPFSLTGKRVWVAGHRGMVGSALRADLQRKVRVLTIDRDALDLTLQAEVERLIDRGPQVVFMAAAKVGGILANSIGRFIPHDNLQMQTISSRLAKGDVEKLLFLGSSCIYPNSRRSRSEEDAVNRPLGAHQRMVCDRQDRRASSSARPIAGTGCDFIWRCRPICMARGQF